MRLQNVCATHLGYTARSRFEPAMDDGVPVIQLRDLSEQGIVDPSRLDRVQLGERVDRYAVTAGDVLFRSRGELNVAVALDARFVEPAIAILPLMILRPNPANILPKYLAWAVNQPAAQRQLGMSAQGTKLRMVPKSSLEALEIDIPDLATQQRIVAVADLAAREEALLHQVATTKRTLINHLLAQRAKGKPPATPIKESRA
jgi:hypothetical protein